MSEAAARPSDDVTWRDINGEIVALNLKSGEYYTFNEIGRSIWLAVTEGKSPDEIEETITHEYDVERDTVASDVNEFINGLIQKGVLERSVPTAATVVVVVVGCAYRLEWRMPFK